MGFKNLPLKLVASAFTCVPILAQAVPITVDFTVTAERSGTYGSTTYNGYAPGAPGFGYFTFEDAQGPLLIDTYGGGTGRAATDLSFSWLGREWDEAGARIGLLTFDNGSLTRWVIGGLFAGDCGVHCVDSVGPTDFWVRSDAGASGAILHDENAWGFMWGRVAWSIRPTQVPEPGALGLLSIALAGTVIAARRRRARKHS